MFVFRHYDIAFAIHPGSLNDDFGQMVGFSSSSSLCQLSTGDGVGGVFPVTSQVEVGRLISMFCGDNLSSDEVVIPEVPSSISGSSSLIYSLPMCTAASLNFPSSPHISGGCSSILTSFSTNTSCPPCANYGSSASLSRSGACSPFWASFSTT